MSKLCGLRRTPHLSGYFSFYFRLFLISPLDVGVGRLGSGAEGLRFRCRGYDTESGQITTYFSRLERLMANCPESF